MSLIDLKSDLKRISQNMDALPFRATRRYTKERKKEIIWLMPKVFGLRGNGNIVYQNKRNQNRGKRKDYKIETFFFDTRLTHDEERWVRDEINDLIMFIDQKQGILKAREITKCRNAEYRRILLERYGYERFLHDMQGKILHRDGDNSLVRVDWHKEEEPLVFVRVKDSSTSRMYALRVPPEMKRCKQAIAWTFNLEERQYVPLKET